MLFDYNNKSEKSIYDYAKKLEGMTFREVLDEYKDSMYKTYDDFHHLRTKVNDSPNISYLNKDPGYIYNPKAKGQLGGLLENCYFGYKPNSDPHADFFDVGVELKSTPIEKKNNGGYRAGERLSITNISFEEPVEDDFYKSHVWEKIKRILLIQYLRDKSIDRLDYMIEFVNLFTPPKEDLKIIIDDYNAINKKIKQGKAHELSEGDTMYLGACTKGATAKKSMRPQYYGDHELAKKRNYCFKTAYMNFVLKNYILKNNVPYESIVKEKIDSTVQDYILKLINRHIGQTDEELCKEYNREYNNNKAQWKDLSFRMLGIKGNHAAELEKANIVVKTIRIEENGKNKESMSFAPFKAKELVNENWEDSTVYEYFEATQFLFVVFKKSGNRYKLKGAKLWHMPYHDLNKVVHEEWGQYQNIIKNGVKFEITNSDSGKMNIKNNLPGQKDTKIIHIRPHSQKAAYKLNNGVQIGNVERDADELPNGEWMTRQSFWLNREYVLKQLKDLL